VIAQLVERLVEAQGFAQVQILLTPQKNVTMPEWLKGTSAKRLFTGSNPVSDSNTYALIGVTHRLQICPKG